MTDEQWGGPSLLPGWSRSHVVAHLTLNAQALSGALEGLHEGRQVPIRLADPPILVYAAIGWCVAPIAQRRRDLGLEQVSQALILRPAQLAVIGRRAAARPARQGVTVD